MRKGTKIYPLARRAFLLGLCLQFLASGAWGQEIPQPEPYSPDEFDPALTQIRRSEIIALGSFPFSYFLITTVYDLARFSFRSISAGQVDNLYAPWFFAPQNKPGFTDEEQVGLLLGAFAISFVIVGIDLLLGAIEETESADADRPTGLR